MQTVESQPISVFPEHVQRWAALRTAARWEKQIAGMLAGAGLPVFLPLMTKVTHYRGKRQSSIVPLFSGYVFCAEEDFLANPRVPTIARKRVAQILRPNDYEQLRQELFEVAEFLNCRQLIQERVFGRPGDLVRVVGGPLRGSEGVIRRLVPAKRIIIIEISFLGTRVEVDIEENMLARL